MADDIRQTQKPVGKWLRIVLVISLSINLLIVGALAGAALSGGKWHHRVPPGMMAPGGPLTGALSFEDRRAIARRMRAAIRKDFAGLMEDLRAKPFDPEAVAARLAAIRGGFRQRMDLGQALLVERLAGMGPAERAAFADRLETELRRRHR